MSLAQLYNIPASVNDLSEFSFSNQDHHLQISRAIKAQGGPDLPIFLVDPIPTFDTGVFLWQHQQMHNAQNQALGILGSDLTDLDFNDKDSLEEWIYIHGSEHYQAALILGLS